MVNETDHDFDPRLEGYLPADLWRELTVADPGRRTLLKAAERLRSLRYLLSTYLPTQLAQEIIRRPDAGRVRGETLSGTCLFADVSGFTALSERLASQGREGSERLTEMINRYFAAMIEILAWSGGILQKFAGDALLVAFPEQAENENARWAVRAGLRMMRAMAAFSSMKTPPGTVSLKMKIGISSGNHTALTVGSAKRMEYVLLGETIARTMAAEGAAEAGQVVVDGATAAVLPPSQYRELPSGFFAISGLAEQEMGSFEVSAKMDRHKTTPLLLGRGALLADFPRVLSQIEALRAFIPAALVERILARQKERQVESEFRPVAVIFVNIIGLEKLLTSPQRGVDGTARILNDYFVTMQRVVSNQGGVISRIDPYGASSKMLLLFGAPVAHEDDAQRAVRAALSMRAELASLNKRWRRARLPRPAGGAAELAAEVGPLISQRIGITLGETFAGQAGSSTRREYTVMGDDVNLSARLMAAAQPDQILVSHKVAEATRDHFHLRDLTPIRVKGKSELIPIYQAEGARHDRLARRLHGRGPLLSRERELAQGRAALSRALEGQGSILSIRGPAGMGKSHLLDALLADALERDLTIYLSEGGDSISNSSPFAGWITHLHAMAKIRPNDPAELRGAKLQATLTKLKLTGNKVQEPLFKLLGLQSVAPPRRQLDPPPPPDRPPAKEKAPSLFALLGERVDKKKEGLDIFQLVWERGAERSGGGGWERLGARIADRERDKLTRAVGKLLERISAGAPLLLVFEDAQWLDPSSQTLLDHLAESLNCWSILILIVERCDDGVAPSGPTISLGPLSASGTGAMVTQLLTDLVAPAELPELAQAVHRQSGGNPLLIEEIAAWLRRTGPRSPGDLGTGLRESSTLQELVISRLDSLPHDQREMAKAASLVGVQFASSDVSSLLGRRSEPAVLDDSLADLEKAQLTLLAQAGSDPAYVFRQMLVRELIYDTLSFARRRELHARLAARLEARHTDDPTMPVELLAHHHELAGQWLPAARYGLLSGQQARQRYAYSQAGETYKKALAMLERTLPENRTSESAILTARAHEGQGDISLLNGDHAAAAAAYLVARSLLPDSDPPEKADDLTLRLWRKQALILPTQGEAAEAEACAGRALAAHPAGKDLAAVATLAWLAWRENSERTKEWIERGRSLTEAGSDRWTVGVAALLADLAGEWEWARSNYLALDRPIGAALASCYQGDRALEGGELASALEHYQKAAEKWQEENDAEGLALAHYRKARAYWRDSDTAAANAMLAEILTLLENSAQATEDDRVLLEQARGTIQSGLSGVWPSWRWQRYDDAFRISILFKP